MPRQQAGNAALWSPQTCVIKGKLRAAQEKLNNPKYKLNIDGKGEGGTATTFR